MKEKIDIIFLICLGCVLFRHEGDRNYKSYLQKEKKKSILQVKVFNSYFSILGFWIGYDSDIKGEPNFSHNYSDLFILGRAIIGKNVVIFQHVTIGSCTIKNSKGLGVPAIGDNVCAGGRAKIIAKVPIGDNCRIGANSVVYKDISPNTIAVQAPICFISKGNLDNRYYSVPNNRWKYLESGRWMEAKEDDCF